MTVDPSALDLGHLATFVGHAYEEHVQQALARHGLSGLRHAHGYVFQHLVEAAPTLGELAARMEVTQQGASKAVAELCELGYVERLQDPDDARVRRIHLSARGRQAVSVAREARAELDARLAGLVELGAVREGLGVILRELGAMPRIRGRRVRPPR